MDSEPKFTGLVWLNAGGIARVRGGPLEFLDRDYLIGVDSDYVVKFRGDRPSELEDHVSD